MMKDNGITRKDLEAAVLELRKGAKVDSQTAEDRFNSLNLFAINTERKGKERKLDPVIEG
jgi:ATP-dependent Clp protease ATP-binding subunit ClpB